jgi:bifunctional oligoribonuclease and PAP phosphatase NrnA
MISSNNKYSDEDLKKILNQIEISRKIIVTTHINPDGDAVGSVLALFHYLNQKGKEVTAISYSTIPDNLKFITGSEIIEQYDSEKHDALIESADLIVISDLNDIDRLKTVGEAISRSKAEICVIDHHLEPKPFADYYLIDSEASSACEVLYNLFNFDKRFQMNDKIALALYVGLMTDTGSFRFSNTNHVVFKIAADLLKYNVSPAVVYDEVFNTLSLNGLKLLGEAFSGLKTYYNGKLALMVIPKELFEKTKAQEDDMENFAEEILCFREALVGVLITEITERNEIRLSFRSKDSIDVRNLAIQFGGGGHLQAAGARVYNRNLGDVINDIIEKAKPLF